MSEQNDRRPPPKPEEVGLIPVFTFVVWTTRVLVTLIDFLVSPPRAAPPTTQPSLTVETLDVDLTSTPPEPVPPPDLAQPPVAEAASPMDDAPASPYVAAPNSAIAFEQPVDAPATIPRAINLAAVLRPQHLTFGLGAGNQLQPEYPREAALDNQQGTVRIEFTVGQTGRVQSAQITVPSPWPLLNQAALRAVRDTWVFPTGPPRLYDIDIQFYLQP